MIAADPRKVAVARENHNIEFRISELYSGRECNSPAVRRMKAVGVDIAGKPRRTTDS